MTHQKAEIFSIFVLIQFYRPVEDMKINIYQFLLPARVACRARNLQMIPYKQVICSYVFDVIHIESI